MRDGPTRRVVKRLALWHHDVNLVTRRALARGTRYGLGGECRRCARCCEEPSIRVGWLFWHVRSLRRLFLWWQREVNGFHLSGRDPITRTLFFRCSHFDWQTRSCDSYDSRPGMCRDYPRELLEQPYPELFDECGFRPIAPNAERLLRELGRQNLEPETLVQLKRKLYLE